MITIIGILLIIVGWIALQSSSDAGVLGFILLLIGLYCLGVGFYPILQQLK